MGRSGRRQAGICPSGREGRRRVGFATADDHERANGKSYREFELALPKELSDADRGKLVRELVAEELGDWHAYSRATHEPNGHNPYVHIMFSERISDGIERGPEQDFKSADTNNPERGGHLKAWVAERPESLKQLNAHTRDLTGRVRRRRVEQRNASPRRLHRGSARRRTTSHPHMLRHSRGYKLASDGQGTPAIQQYLGHKDIIHTVRYTELNPESAEVLEGIGSGSALYGC